ncbi:MAG: PLP-dependent decarboxylase [Microscillaceae bacterium]|nr:PLP-dependent decarboxylase [Microscillaceae bacterium]
MNATAGTTVLGMYDPFEALAQVCRPQGLWLHIDGAFGGSALLSRQYRHLLKGCEQADSFAWNAHKMMGVPLTASVVLFRQKGMLRKHLSEKAEYLYQGEDDYNPGEYSLQCGRRNDALKVWAAWKYYGDEGYEARVNRQFALSHYAARQVEADPALELVQAPECLNVCFAVKGHSAKELCRELDEAGLLKVGYGRFGKREFIRMVCIDPDLEESDLDHVFAWCGRWPLWPECHPPAWTARLAPDFFQMQAAFYYNQGAAYHVGLVLQGGLVF